MLSWFLNPWMLVGGLAVASPILIHLLNKRRFKIVDWAAMDFLFQADKKNRRRVQLENFILLMLRCLAMLLVAMMLARPFLPSGVTSFLQQSQKFERILLIDDSLSQRVVENGQPAIEITKSSVSDLIARLASSDKSEDWLTVMLTSQPDAPLLANEPLTPGTLPALNQTISEIETSDQVADYPASLSELKRYISGGREEVSRVTYFYSDMRKRDWIDVATPEAESAPNKLIDEIAADTLGTFVIDVGSSADDNLAVVDVRPENLQVAKKTIRFLVQVANYGSQTVNDVRVLLQIDEGQPEYEVLPSIAPGQIEEVAFRHVFPETVPADVLADDESLPAPFQNFRVRAEIDRQSLGEQSLAQDQLSEDSGALFASRVIDAISVLLVDGDPSAVSSRSETHWLRKLNISGTGVDTEVITVSELETVSLSRYQVIFLANVDEASADRVKSLERWVAAGGALVFMPGNRVRAETFNEAFYQDGQGLSPVQLTEIAGDLTMSQWVYFEIDPQVHPALQFIVDGDITSGFRLAEVFSWWKSKIDQSRIGKTLSVPLRFSDQDGSPAMVERPLGSGKVVAFMLPADGDWSMWPSTGIFSPMMLELIDYLVGTRIEESRLEVGGTVSYPVDLSVYSNRVALRNPDNEKVEAIATPVKDAVSDETESDNREVEDQVVASPDDQEQSRDEAEILYSVRFKDIPQRGFYTLELTRHTGEVDPVLLAVNYDTDESRLERLPSATLEGDFFSDRVSRVSTDELASKTVSGGNSEIWMQLLMALFGILLVEQFLGWYWGRKR